MVWTVLHVAKTRTQFVYRLVTLAATAQQAANNVNVPRHTNGIRQRKDVTYAIAVIYLTRFVELAVGFIKSFGPCSRCSHIEIFIFLNRIFDHRLEILQFNLIAHLTRF
jgi:hypothetical protein